LLQECHSYQFLLEHQPPEITSINAPIVPAPLGQSTNVITVFSDPDVGNTHTVVWDWGDNSTTTISATVPSVTTLHTYTSVEVHTVTATIIDAMGASATATFQYVVIYDPNGGFVTGGGWITSPAETSYSAALIHNPPSHFRCLSDLEPAPVSNGIYKSSGIMYLNSALQLPNACKSPGNAA
jgi:PKD repeat protein